ncbi:MAG: hypothetical protein ABSC14_00240 [Desulfomonilia bacterium]|jgi:hypothetical protein
MKTNRGVIYIFAIVLVVLAACTSSRTGGAIHDKGKQIEITTKDHSVKALKMASLEDTFVLFTANPVLSPDSLKYLDSHIIVMPKKDADQLKVQYGNFVDVQNKGHDTARKSIRHLSLIAADGTTQKQIKKLIALNSHKLFPLIKLSMTELQVTELLYQKSKVFLSGDLGKQYLVSKIEIIEENYPL